MRLPLQTEILTVDLILRHCQADIGEHFARHRCGRRGCRWKTEGDDEREKASENENPVFH